METTEVDAVRAGHVLADIVLSLALLGLWVGAARFSLSFFCVGCMF